MNSKTRINIVRARTAEGWSCARIAPEAECSTATVNKIQREKGFINAVRRAAIAPPPREVLLTCSGMKYSEICQKFGRKYSTILRWYKACEIVCIRRGPRVGKMLDLQQVRALAGEGFCVAHIAEKMEFAPVTILKVARENQIELSVGDTNANVRKRPERAEFVEVYKKYKLAELASLYGVNIGTVSKWALHFGLREAAPARRPRLMHGSVCARPIAGSCTPAAIERALAKMGAR